MTMDAAPKWTETTGRAKSHACNCIGCCRICGQCRTAPWHAATCAEVADARRRITAAIERA